MDLDEVLERVGAPRGLVERVRDASLDLDQAWDECTRGEDRVWLAACGGAPVAVVVQSAAEVVLETCEQLGRGTERIAEAAALAQRGDVEALEETVVACEAIAEADPATYREPVSAGLGHAARAGALVGHAALAKAEGDARREAPRLERARHMAAILGVGSHVTLPAKAGPARLEPVAEPDPAQASFAFAIAAAAEAIAECEAALRAMDPHAAGEIGPWVDSIVRAALEEEE